MTETQAAQIIEALEVLRVILGNVLGLMWFALGWHAIRMLNGGEAFHYGAGDRSS